MEGCSHCGNAERRDFARLSLIELKNFCFVNSRLTVAE